MKKNNLYIFQDNIIHLFRNVANFEVTENGATFTFAKETTFSSKIAAANTISTPVSNSKVTIFPGGMFVEWESSNSN